MKKADRLLQLLQHLEREGVTRIAPVDIGWKRKKSGVSLLPRVSMDRAIQDAHFEHGGCCDPASGMCFNDLCYFILKGRIIYGAMAPWGLRISVYALYVIEPMINRPTYPEGL